MKYSFLIFDVDGTLFDFDSGGPGWRAMDLAIFRVSNDDATWNAFLGGYRDVRAIDDLDIEAVPLFAVMCRAYLIGFAGFRDLLNFAFLELLIRFMIQGLVFWLVYSAIVWAIQRFLFIGEEMSRKNTFINST